MSDANFDADLDRDNFEKLCGKIGELVELRRKQVLIGAARLLKENCESTTGKCEDCPFYSPECGWCRDCKIAELYPCDWEVQND
jgi:hypothetical protein